jgi:predicted amidohydrolase
MMIFKKRAIKVAAVQFDVIPDDPERNLITAGDLVDKLADAGVELVTLSATFATGLNFPSIGKMAESIDGRIGTWMQEKAAALNITMIGGVLEKEESGHIYDTAVAVSADGSILGSYRRRSLWSGEMDFISKGDTPTVIETDWGKIGLIVSHDIWFPESCRSYLDEGVSLLVCPAMLFRQHGHFLGTLARSRAAECCAFMIYCNGLGENRLAGYKYNGKSMILNGFITEDKDDPDQDVLACAERRETVLLKTIQLSKQRKQAKVLPFREDRRICWDRGLQ